MTSDLPEAWRAALCDVDCDAIDRFVAEERARCRVYPAECDVFAALAHTPPDRVRVVIVGQDPYHGPGQAHGFAFSVPRGIAKPPSLVNIHRELHDDVGVPIPAHGSLIPWADRGVLLLNTSLTVREGEAGSHANRGWERFTDAVLISLARGERPIVFVLWGAHAQKKAKLVERPPHVVLRGVHPSPLSAHRGFFGSKPFSAIDRALVACGGAPMDWSLEEV